MTTFEKATDYIASCTTTTARIAAVEAIITQLLVSAATLAESGHIDEYWLNDGQVQIRCKYRSMVDLERSVLAFRRLAIMFRNDKTGRVTRLVDASNFNGGYGRTY